MTTNRLEAFSDGVLAIIITIMVLELKVPHGSDFETLIPLFPKFLSYLFSFIYVGIYWNNHHHLFQAIEKVNGKVLLANLGLLFWLSLLPFVTGWMGENHFAENTVALYGFVLLMCALSFLFLEKSAIKHEGEESNIGQALANRWKERISTTGYFSGIVLAFFYPIASIVIFYSIALLWLMPDQRIEKRLNQKST
ncbi:TMEM175 family protein [Aquirufa aurantiipilula]|uniref:TMEM175 family protein n=1 Tax=Aquirufa aurantiipilula TaxID=2696561 RepID=A0ABT6BKF4_9BACT|nr:TMEM175 family protein [Aquirufa aurantiipilula]MDF5690720.1 TMEM175 family protein [Aquirufa aurantiipilula]